MTGSKTIPLACENLRFDAYAATTTKASWWQLLQCFPEHEELQTRSETVNIFRYTRAVYMYNTRGKQVGRILFSPDDPEVFIEVKGELADPLARTLRQRYQHQVSRADICIDTRQPGAFRKLLNQCRRVKKMNGRVRSECRGDWDDHPEDGRTFYLGSKSSLCQVCLYEKGKTRPYRGMGLEDWVRIEWRFRPETKEQKLLAASLEPHEMFMLSTMGRRLAELVLVDYDGTQKFELPRLKSSAEAAFDAMLGQYSKTMWKMAGKMGGVENVLAEIGLRLTGQPWRAIPMVDVDSEDPPFSNMEGQDDHVFDQFHDQNPSWNGDDGLEEEVI